MTRSVFRMTVPELERQQRGQGITADKLNEPVDALTELTRGVGAPRMYQPEGTGSGAVSAGVGAQIGFVIITAASGSGDTITVRSVKRTEEGEYETVGSSFEALVWPGHIANDFAPLVTGSMLYAKVVPIIMVSDAKYVMQQFRWDTATPSSAIERGDCRLT